MRILGIAGSVRRGSHNRRLLRAAGDMLPPGVEFVEWEGLAGLPIFDEDLEDSPPPAVQEFLDRGRGGRRPPDRHPRVQRVGPRRAQERARLGLAPVPRQRAAREAGRGDRGEHRPVRRRLGAGGGPQGAQGVGRARARLRAAGRDGGLGLRARRHARRPRARRPPRTTCSATCCARWGRRSSNRCDGKRHDGRRARAPAVRRRPDAARAGGRRPQPPAHPGGGGGAGGRARHRARLDGRRRPRGVRRHRDAVPPLRRPRRARAGAAGRAHARVPGRADLRAAAAGARASRPPSACARSARATSTSSSATSSCSSSPSRPGASSTAVRTRSTARTSRCCCARRRRTSTPSSPRRRCSRRCARRSTSTGGAASTGRWSACAPAGATWSTRSAADRAQAGDDARHAAGARQAVRGGRRG